MEHLRNRGGEEACKDDNNKLLQHQSLSCQIHSKQPTGAFFSDRAIKIDSICSFMRIKSKHTHNTEVLILHFFLNTCTEVVNFGGKEIIFVATTKKSNKLNQCHALEMMY